MRTSFQNTLSTHQFALPVVSVLAIIAWIIFPAPESVVTSYDNNVWALVPEAIHSGFAGKMLGLIIMSITIYTMVEFSNAMVLLRVTSRMLSTTLVFLITITLCLHAFQPAHIAMLLTLLSYFTTFSSYQRTSPSLMFSSHLFMAAAAILCPKLLLFNLLTFITQVYIGSTEMRGFVAAIIGTLTPFWFFLVFAVFSDRFDVFIDFFADGFDLSLPKISGLTQAQYLTGLYVFISFITGLIGYAFTYSHDKIRQRTIYNVIAIHGVVCVLMALANPSDFNVFLGLFMIDTSIITGRFWVITENRFTHFYFIVLTLWAALVLALTTNM